jgi:hypothetical protein
MWSISYYFEVELSKTTASNPRVLAQPAMKAAFSQWQERPGKTEGSGHSKKRR